MRNSVPGHTPRIFAAPIAQKPRSDIDRWIAVISRTTIVISFVFVILPAVDLEVSGWFSDGSVFILADQPFLKALRQVGLKGPVIAIALLLLLLGLRVFPSIRHLICAPRRALFVILSFATGQVIVEVIKPLIGRARPRNIVEFGGDAGFTPLWQLSSECSSNCSLPSGEAAAAAAGLSLLIFVPAKYRQSAAILLTPMLALVAFNRVLFGAHFLSDVMLSWLLTMLAMAWLWKLLVADTDPDGTPIR
jgi:lipid A 4'-phosphatase